MHVNSSILFPFNIDITDVCTLLDTGAISANYMGETFYNNHFEQLAPFTTYVDKQVRLGDTQTIRRITKIVDISVRFELEIDYDPHRDTTLGDNNNSNSNSNINSNSNNTKFTKSYVTNVICNVFETGHDLIIGLPTLLGPLQHYFIELFHLGLKPIFFKKNS